MRRTKLFSSILNLRKTSSFSMCCRPVIITDAVPDWPASNWTREFFLQNYGKERVVMKAVDVSGRADLCIYFALILILSQQTRDADPALLYCWRSVADGDPTLKQHWVCWIIIAVYVYWFLDHNHIILNWTHIKLGALVINRLTKI